MIELFLQGQYSNAVDVFLYSEVKILNAKISQLKNVYQDSSDTDTTAVWISASNFALSERQFRTTVQPCFTSLFSINYALVSFLHRIEIPVWLQIIGGERLIFVWLAVFFPFLMAEAAFQHLV